MSASVVTLPASRWYAAYSADSLLTKPNSGMTPAIDAAASVAATAVTGMIRPMPWSRRRSRVWAAWSTTPTDMNSVALNNEWARSTATPANTISGSPWPTSRTMKPSCETVPNASSALRSVSRSARQPPSSIVVPPTTTRVVVHQSTVGANAGPNRARR